MPLKIASHPTPPPPDTTEADLAAFRAQYLVVRRKAKELCRLAGVVADSTDDYWGVFNEAATAYLRQFEDTWLAVQELIALAVTLSPGAREKVEAGVGKLFTETGALTPWWRELWLTNPAIQEAARARRINSRKAT